jgi:TetR/AcrR family transcriptional repressor of nem operon
MKITREEVKKNRRSILERASKLFRASGFDGVSIADIMESVGLTHGAFYGHFESKDDLIAQACASGASATNKGLAALAEKHPENPMARFVRSYLSAKHRDDRSNSCIFAALGADIARQDGAVRRAFTAGLRENIALLARMAPGSTDGIRRADATSTMCGLVGALILARAVDDYAFSDEILRAAAVRLSPDPAKLK